MYYNPYIRMLNQCYMMNKMNSNIRLLHASPNAPEVDIYADDNLIVEGLAYKELSKYIPLKSGNYNIKIYASGTTTNPVIDTKLFIPENIVYNIAAIGMLPDIDLYAVQEPTTANKSGVSCIRFIHLSPDAPSVDIKLDDGTIVFSNVPYKSIANYICIQPGTFSFNVVLTGTDNVVLSVPDVKLEPNGFYTVYAVGLAGDSPELEALIIPEPRKD